MIRIGKQSDYKSLYDLYLHPTIYPELIFDPMSYDEFCDYFTKMIAGDAWYVYEYDNKIVASCVVSTLQGRYKHIAYIGIFATSPAYQGRGFGSQLLQYVLVEIKKNKTIRRIELTAETDKKHVMKFYEKNGFQEESRHIKRWSKMKNNKLIFVDESIMVVYIDRPE